MDDVVHRVHGLAYHLDPLAALAGDILHRHAGQLPDLSRISIFLPQATAATRLRQLLLDGAQQAGHAALLGPDITTLRAWVVRQPLLDLNIISRQTAELLLVKELAAHPALFGHGNPWTLADSLLELFENLTLHQIALPTSLDDFTRTLQEAYGARIALGALGREAELVHTLWFAWHEQLRAENRLDEAGAYLLKLSASLADLPPDRQLYWLADHHPAPPEIAWATQLLQGRQLRVYLCGTAAAAATPYDMAGAWPETQKPAASDTIITAWLNAAFATDRAPLAERARDTAQIYPASPLQERLRIFSADSAEQEAAAIDIQIRLWLLQGKRSIGVMTESRRLARRLRALLERAGIHVDDAAGWALSTTSAAAVLARWLECIEEDFPYQSLLDLIRAPFFAHGAAREALLETSYRLEQDIVRHESIPRGLRRYRQHIEYRRKRLPADLAARYAPLLELLEHLEKAAAPLLALRRQPQPAPRWLQTLQESLTTLGVHGPLAADAAGSRILQELETMAEAGRAAGTQLGWTEFRAWLGRTLERFNFQPPVTNSPVQLFNLTQSAAVHCDALIIAGAERETLPGPGTISPFFNGAVRVRLGLADDRQRLAQRFRWFRALLEAAPEILITHRREDQGEAIAPSPWLAQLLAFHRHAYGHDLQDAQLKSLSHDLRAQVRLRDRPLPAVQAANPSTPVPAELLPGSLSAAAYQSLMDCPYQFFAARCLQLAPPDAVREALEKSDYGERVHRCLQAFHTTVTGLPPPFSQALTPDRRAAAIARMEAIAAAVFARDLEDNFAHRGWYKAWLRQIPEYIDWEIEHAETWRVLDVERDLSREGLIDRIQLRGRLDRLDAAEDRLGIIDYKTGRLPDQNSVDTGEAVQLTCYAMLLPEDESARLAQVAYLSLDNRQVKLKTLLTGDALRQLTDAGARRLQLVVEDMRNGMALTAWGDQRTCGYCKMDGLCRKPVWNREEIKAADS